MSDEEYAPSQDQVDKFDYLSPMLDSALAVMREFSKKKQEGIVSVTKIKILNKLLSELREILSGQETANYLDPLNEEDLPQNSDAVLILGQYRAALNTFKTDHQRSYGHWTTKESIEDRAEY